MARVTRYKHHLILECECGKKHKFKRVPASYHCDGCGRGFERKHDTTTKAI